MLTSKKERHRARARYARGEQKLQTRQALMEAALNLLKQRSFDGLSLREVTREVGVVPAAFYRHFAGMEALGLALVDESMSTLRQMLREQRTTPLPAEEIIPRSVEILVRQVHDHRAHFGFIAREMYGGHHAVRQAIRREIQSFV